MLQQHISSFTCEPLFFQPGITSVNLTCVKRYDQAQETCEEALKYDPKNVKARFRRGMAHRDMFMFREALTDLKACAKLVPDDPQMEEEMQITKRMSDERRQAGHKDEYIGCICGPQYINDEDMEEDHWMFEPGLDEIPERIPAGDDSDSSDFEHKGNGNPCRSYNRDGCQNGGPKKCRFRHAPPKEGTTRDELGRNVCNRWLLSGCTKGNSCPYAHSKEYLPEEGWWTAGEQFEAMKDVMSTLNMIQGMSPAALSAYERRLDMGSFYDDDDDDFY
ncbi:hypothetical protein VKT23_002507 [Stygiomarasmius scandens]|uniref:C3H1-type domain-containing protein n=1 Tax=Marasmiellus scandens TaxID=2682957 RepID=A0ABR1K693_9AGAR